MDKRTKEYKEWKKRQDAKSKGLGDDVAKVTKATGIDKLVKFVAGEDCGCDERQEQLNKVFSYDVPECLTEDEFNYLTQFFNNPPEIVSVDVQKRMLAIHNRIFKEQKQPSSCASCVKQTFKKLQKVLNNY